MTRFAFTEVVTIADVPLAAPRSLVLRFNGSRKGVPSFSPLHFPIFSFFVGAWGVSHLVLPISEARCKLIRNMVETQLFLLPPDILHTALKVQHISFHKFVTTLLVLFQEFWVRLSLWNIILHSKPS